jgi:hypothetical protein
MMQTTHIKSTSHQAKADFRKHGPRVSDAELKKMERRDELEARADRLKELEKKRKQSKRKREEREGKERDAKRRMGIGLATQLAGFSHTQKRMKSGMETFLGKVKSNGKENVDSRGCSSAKTEGISASKIPLGGDIGQFDGMNERDKEDNYNEELWDTDSNFLDDEKLLKDLEPVQEDFIAMPPPRLLVNTIPAAMKGSKNTQGGRIGGDSRKMESCVDPDFQTESTPDEVFKVAADESDQKSNDPASPEIQQQPAQIKASLSPNISWDDFIVSNTQVRREISQPTTPSKSSLGAHKAIPSSTQDLDFSPTNVRDLRATPKTNYTNIDAIDGIASCDFAYFGCTSSGNVVLKRPSFPPPRSRSFSRPIKAQTSKSMSATLPKTIASDYRPPPAERSFTSKYEGYGLSTQILQDALDDTESDTEEEDFMAAIPVSERDRILMPPPPLRTSPKVFKPPSPSSTTSRYGHVGLSTQILQDVVCEEASLSDDELKEQAASSSFGAEDLGEAFWDDALKEH